MAIVIAIGVNDSGQREVLGLDVGPSEDGAFWHAFLRGLVSRGLSGVKLVTSDVHEGLKGAIAAVLQGASWQRCRTHYADLRIMPMSRPTVLSLRAKGRHNPDGSGLEDHSLQMVRKPSNDLVDSWRPSNSRDSGPTRLTRRGADYADLFSTDSVRNGTDVGIIRRSA
jgi:hypothetical protein